MIIQIKLLGRDPIAVEVTPETLIVSIKKQICSCLGIPIDIQRILFNGKILTDDLKINQFTELRNYSKLNLIILMKKKHPLYNEMYKIVRLYCTEQDTLKILSIFMKKMYDSFRLLSLDDLERIAYETLSKLNAQEHRSFLEVRGNRS